MEERFRHQQRLFRRQANALGTHSGALDCLTSPSHADRTHTTVPTPNLADRHDRVSEPLGDRTRIGKDLDEGLIGRQDDKGFPRTLIRDRPPPCPSDSGSLNPFRSATPTRWTRGAEHDPAPFGQRNKRLRLQTHAGLDPSARETADARRRARQGVTRKKP